MTLERAYRRLLACYPWQHRREYEQEMLGVLLDDAAPGQRRPRARDVLDLLRGAFRSHLRYAVTDVTDQRWRDAAAVLSVLAPLAMLAYTARPLLITLGAGLLYKSWDFHPFLQWHSGFRAIAWVVVLTLALAGRHRIAAVGAWVAAALEAIRASGDYTGLLQDRAPYSARDLWLLVLPAGEGQRFAAYSVRDLWPLVLAIVAAVSLGAGSRRAGSPRAGSALLGRRRVMALGGAALLGTSAPAIDLTYRSFGAPGGFDGNLWTNWIFTNNVNYLEAVLLISGFALGLTAVLSTPAPLRRRLLALLAPVAATLVLTRIGFTEWGFLTRPFTGRPTGLLPVQWLALVLTPPLVLAVSVALVRRREQTLRLLALGRAADSGGAASSGRAADPEQAAGGQAPATAAEVDRTA